MIECPNCGKINLNNDKFCGECGTKLPELKNYCPECEIIYENGNKFCTNCGSKLVNKIKYENNIKEELIYTQSLRPSEKELASRKRNFLENWDYDSLLRFQNLFTDGNYTEKSDLIEYIDSKFNFDEFVNRKGEMNTDYKIDDSLAKIFKDDDSDVLKYEYVCGNYSPIYGSSVEDLKIKVNEMGLPLDLSDIGEIGFKQFTMNIPTEHYSDEVLSFDYPNYYFIGNIPENTPDYCKVGLVEENNQCEIYISVFEDNSPYKPPNNEKLLRKYLVQSGYSAIKECGSYCFNALYENFELGKISSRIIFVFKEDNVIMIVCNMFKEINYDCSKDLEIISKNIDLIMPIQENTKKESFVKKFLRR